MYIDTHAHLYTKQFDSDRPEMVKRAIDAGLEYLLLPNIDMDSIPGMLALEDAFPDICRSMMGLHPSDVGPDYVKHLNAMLYWFEKRSFVAVGEIGLDYYWSKEFVEEQKDAFRTQIRWAKEMNLPIAVHARDSMDDVISIIGELQDGSLKGVLHCFTGTLEQAQKALDLGFYLGFGGVLTYKNSGLAEIVPHLPLDKLLLETDAPYLAPIPHRGKRNESAYVIHVAQKLSECLNIPIEQVAFATTENAKKLFGLFRV